MELNNIKNEKSGSVFYFNKFQKLKFNTFEIYLGHNNQTEYFFDTISDKNNYGLKVKKEDYEKLGLIDKKRININELLEYSRLHSIEKLVLNVNNSVELFNEIRGLLKHYLEVNSKGKFEIGNFQFVYFIDGVETEIKDVEKKNKIKIYNYINHIFWIYILSVIIFCFINLNIGLIILFFPGLIYFYWGIHRIFKEMRDGKNIFRFYLIDVPLFFIFKIIILGWFSIPFYFFYESSFYFLLMEFIGGVVGGSIWVFSYLFIMFYLGEKLLGYLDFIEEKIKSKF